MVKVAATRQGQDKGYELMPANAEELLDMVNRHCHFGQDGALETADNVMIGRLYPLQEGMTFTWYPGPSEMLQRATTVLDCLGQASQARGGRGRGAGAAGREASRGASREAPRGGVQVQPLGSLKTTLNQVLSGGVRSGSGASSV